VSHKFISFKGHSIFFALAMGFCLFTAGEVYAQEALRLSLAGDLAAASRQQSSAFIGYYNLLTGPVAWRFSSGLDLQYDDNVRLRENNAEGDFIIRPRANVQTHWPVTLKNSLDFNLNAGYSEYLLHQDLSQFYIDPGSGIAFDIYTGDWVIELHDRVSITENTYENAGVNANNNNATLENTIGVDGLWDLNKAIIKIGYDHADYVQLASATRQFSGSSENIFFNGGVRLRPEILAGLETGGGLIHYDQAGRITPDALQWNAGAFASLQVSEYISARLDAGYTEYVPDTTSTNLATADSSGFYFQFLLTHRVNKYVKYSLTAGRSTDFSYSGLPQTYYFVRLQPTWNIFRKYNLSTPITWQNGTQLYNKSADYDQYSFGINISRQITQKLSGSLSYQFVKETSDLEVLNYTVNIVGLNFTYQF
jgi:hypothetical protein